MDPSQIPASVLEGPATAPPPGVVPNLKNPPSDGLVLVILPAILVVLMWVFVAVRLSSKNKNASGFRAEDITCFIAAIFTTLYFAITTASVYIGHVGTHFWNTTLADLLNSQSIIVDYLAAIFAPITLLFIKITFFLLFISLFRPMYRLKVASWIGIVVSVLGYVGFFIAFMVLATPRRGETWASHFLSPMQARLSHLSIPLPAFDLALDIYILILPLIGVFKLQLTFKRKLGVAVVFLTAIVAIVSAVLCIVYRVSIQNDPFGDLTYNLMPVYLTSDIEMTLGVIITCMPSFSGQIHKWVPVFESLGSRIASRFSRSTQSQDFSIEQSSSANSKHAVASYELQKKSPVNSHATIGDSQSESLHGSGIHVTQELKQHSSSRFSSV